MLRIDPIYYPFTALLILTIPFPWLCAAVSAAVFHELAHIAAILLLGGKIHQISISIGSTKIHTHLSTPEKELLCALAGPFGSFLILCFYRIFPRLALCALAQGFFNLIPIYPLDGGRALHCFFEKFYPQKAYSISHIVSNTFLYLLLFLSFLGFIYLSAGPVLPLFFTLFLYHRKKTCKASEIGIQ